jgi:NAD(P)H-flavin reductase
MFRARTGFTRKLLNYVEPDREYWAWIDGPFGPSPVHCCGISKEVGDYGHLLMVTSGIGIAAQLPYIKELLERRRNAEVCTQKISLVWQLDRTGDWESARDWLQQLVEQDAGYVSRPFPILPTIPSSDK